jgi:hypothetical protein
MARLDDLARVFGDWKTEYMVPPELWASQDMLEAFLHANKIEPSDAPSPLAELFGIRVHLVPGRGVFFLQ